MLNLLRITFILILVSCQPLLAAALIGTGIASKTSKETIITFTSNELITFTSFRLDNPPRLVIDIPNAKLTNQVKSLPISSKSVSLVRLGTQQGTDLRIVVDLNSAQPASTVLVKNKKIYNLVIKIQEQGKAASVTSSPQAANQVNEVQVAQTINKKQVIIVIDPGHGGKDPGAIGANGAHEKAIVLAISKNLQALINKEPGMKALLTRSTDRFVPLRERILFARRNNADMFISIHADAGSRTADGASVYIISTGSASSEMAKLLAQKENASDLIGGVKISNKDAAIASMLLDLSIDATIESSNVLGKHLLNGLSRSGGLHKKKVERAGFAVLKAPDIPSVLVETGFISNPKEERKLTTPSYQRTIAANMMQGIKAYFKERPATQLVVKTKENTLKLVSQPYSAAPQVTPPQVVRPQVVPPQTATPPRTNTPKVNKPPPLAKSYTTASGETLAQIATRYKISVTQLKQKNNLPANQLRVPTGTTLILP